MPLKYMLIYFNYVIIKPPLFFGLQIYNIILISQEALTIFLRKIYWGNMNKSLKFRANNTKANSIRLFCQS
jgi:hypothetical protein